MYQIYPDSSINTKQTCVRACCQHRLGGGGESKLRNMLSVESSVDIVTKTI